MEFLVGFSGVWNTPWNIPRIFQKTITSHGGVKFNQDFRSINLNGMRHKKKLNVNTYENIMATLFAKQSCFAFSSRSKIWNKISAMATALIVLNNDHQAKNYKFAV